MMRLAPKLMRGLIVGLWPVLACAAPARAAGEMAGAAGPATEVGGVSGGKASVDPTAEAETAAFAGAIAAARAGDTARAAALFLPIARGAEAGPQPALQGEAQFNLALLYYEGRGLPQNHAEALYWAWRARLSGRPEGRALIARLQDAATPDLRKELAARIEADLEPRVKAGEGRAMLELSFILSELLPEPDLPGAYVWQALSAALETPNAVAARDATFARLASADRAKAQARAMETLRGLCQSGLTDPVCSALF